MEKPVPNLKGKKTYLAHIKNLNQALKHGLKLKKGHQVIRFEQNYWMKLFIMLNIKLKMAENKEFEKDFLSLSTTAFLERP